MSEITQEILKQVQARVKVLQNTRDQIITKQAVQEQKRDEAYKNLRQLGIENPEGLSAQQLQTLANEKKIELSEKVKALEEQLTEGEALITKFQQLTNEG